MIAVKEIMGDTEEQAAQFKRRSAVFTAIYFLFIGRRPLGAEDGMGLNLDDYMRGISFNL